MICIHLLKCIDAQFGAEPLETCDNNQAACIESSDTRLYVKCEEHGKKYIYENSKRNHVISYKMDGGVIVEDRSVPRNTNKCDYMYVVNGAELTAILTELKGVDVSKSLEQIKETLSLYKDIFKNFKHVYARAIITSSTPKLKATPTYMKLEKMLRETYKGNIKIVEKQFLEKDSDLGKRT